MKPLRDERSHATRRGRASGHQHYGSDACRAHRTPPLTASARLGLALQDVQNGRPARPQAKEAPEAYPLGYVEDASEPRTKLAAVFNILLSRQARDLDYRPDLDGTLARHGNPCRNGNSLVEIPGVDEEVAAQLFARLRERTVGHEPFAVAHPDAGRH